jgi:hypothetical protein
MKEVTTILKNALPVAIGVMVGMYGYEQIKKLSNKA